MTIVPRRIFLKYPGCRISLTCCVVVEAESVSVSGAEASSSNGPACCCLRSGDGVSRGGGRLGGGPGLGTARRVQSKPHNTRGHACKSGEGDRGTLVHTNGHWVFHCYCSSHNSDVRQRGSDLLQSILSSFLFSFDFMLISSSFNCIWVIWVLCLMKLLW